MAHSNQSKVTPESAKLKYEVYITEKAHEYSEFMKEAFPTQSALLIAVDNSVRFLETAYEALDGNVTADYFLKHSPLSDYPDQLFTLMALFIESGVFYAEDASAQPFSPSNAGSWKFAGAKKDV